LARVYPQTPGRFRLLIPFLSGPFGENQAGFSFTSALRHLGSPSEKFFKYKFINQIKTHPARNDIVEIL
jgi:hypothetical protein